MWVLTEAPWCFYEYHTICFCWEIRKIFTWYPLLSRHMVLTTKYIFHIHSTCQDEFIPIQETSTITVVLLYKVQERGVGWGFILTLISTHYTPLQTEVLARYTVLSMLMILWFRHSVIPSTFKILALYFTSLCPILFKTSPHLNRWTKHMTGK